VSDRNRISGSLCNFSRKERREGGKEGREGGKRGREGKKGGRKGKEGVDLLAFTFISTSYQNRVEVLYPWDLSLDSVLPSHKWKYTGK
jgi:hypothetical protein